ncbi:MAG: T9SS type A sorting domain-containing protein [Bacteroidia bacterium]
MKKIILPLIIAALTGLSVEGFSQSTCGNRDFEDTTFTNWTAATGDNWMTVAVPVTWVPGLISNGLNASISDPSARHTLITTNFLDTMVIDPITNLPDTQMTSLAPGGGTVTLRLGNNNINAENEKLAYSFVVTPTNYIYTYQFACVMEDPQHLPDEQPYFMVNIYDSSMNIIANGTDTFYSAQPNVPFITTPGGWIKYRRWTNISVDLTAYVGQSVTVEFINSDCALGGHYAYTYIDVSCLGTLLANVWPGDCDYDLQANNVDLLSLGIAYNATGTTRASASNTWVAQPSTDWSTNFPLGANYKHSDCNGDGIVDLNDTLAISLNYGQTHPLRLPANDPNVDVTSLPGLTLVPSVSITGEGNVVTFDIYAGSASIPVNDLYGLAFKLNFDPNLVHGGSSQMVFTNSALGTRNVSMLGMDKQFASFGRNEVGMVSTTHVPVTGALYLGSFSLKTAYNVASISELVVSFSDVFAVDNNYTHIPMNPQSASVTIDPSLPAGITDLQAAPFTFFPNPANDGLNITTNGYVAERIIITNLLGMEVMNIAPANNTTAISTATLAEGMYHVTVISANGRTVKEVVVRH